MREGRGVIVRSGSQFYPQGISFLTFLCDNPEENWRQRQTTFTQVCSSVGHTAPQSQFLLKTEDPGLPGEH